MTKYALCLVSLVFLTGCPITLPSWLRKKPPPQAPVGTQLGPQIGAAEKGANETVEQYKKLAAGAAAGFTVLKSANKLQPSTQATEFADLETTSQLLALPQPDPAKLKEAEERLRAVLAGETERVKELYKIAAADNAKMKQELDKLTAKLTEVFQQLMDLEERRKEEAKRSAERIASLEQAVEKERKAKDEELQRWTGRIFVLAGVVGYGLIAVVLFFSASAPGGIMLGVKKVWVLGILAGLSIGLGQLVSQSWFKYAAGGTLLLAVAGVAVYFFIEYKQGKEAEAKQKALALAESTLATIVPVIDEAGDLVKSEIIPKLRGKMDTDEKALVHEVRAKLQKSARIKPTVSA